MNYLSEQTLICIALVLVLLIALASGIIGWQMGWKRCVDYIDSLNMKNIEGLMRAENLALETAREGEVENDS